MCDLQILWVGVSDELLLVIGQAGGGDCDGIEAVLTLYAPGGQSTWQDTRPASWLDPAAGTWQAAFVLDGAQRLTACEGRVRVNELIAPPAYTVAARCPGCAEEVMYREPLDCCPGLDIAPAEFTDACADPDLTGLLRRPVTVRWTVTRRSVARPIVTRLVLSWPGDSREATRTLDEPAEAGAYAGHSETFSETFLVPGGVALTAKVETVPSSRCAAAERALGTAPVCDCTGQPQSTQPFTVVDVDTGTDLTATVAGSGCINAATVRVSAPPDARAGRFQWVAPAVADAGDRFSTTVEVPDTDDGTLVRAIIGSEPCVQEPEVRLVRCQARPAFCASVRIPCGWLEAVGVFCFYLFLGFFYSGLAFVGGATAKTIDAQEKVAIWLSSATGSSGAGAAGTGGGGAAAGTGPGAMAAYEQARAVMAVWSGTIGLAIIALATLFLVAAALCLAYWVTCCAPRNWFCRFLRLLDWCMAAFLMTSWAWGAVLFVIGMLFQLEYFTIFGAGLGWIFIQLLSGIGWLLVKLLMSRLRCEPVQDFTRPFAA